MLLLSEQLKPAIFDGMAQPDATLFSFLKHFVWRVGEKKEQRSYLMHKIYAKMLHSDLIMLIDAYVKYFPAQFILRLWPA